MPHRHSINSYYCDDNYCSLLVRNSKDLLRLFLFSSTQKCELDLGSRPEESPTVVGVEGSGQIKLYT